MPKFEINLPLQQTIAHDKNLSPEAKELFLLLCHVRGETGAGSKRLHDCCEQFVELLQRNYVFIEGFPASVPLASRDGSASGIRRRGFKMLITGREE